MKKNDHKKDNADTVCEEIVEIYFFNIINISDMLN